MSGWSYGKFCNGCPNELFCDWYCPSIKNNESCEVCMIYPSGCCDGICNNQISFVKRFFRNRFYKLLYKIRLRRQYGRQ